MKIMRINSSLGGFTPVIDETGKITGYKTKAGADTVFPFSGASGTLVIEYSYSICVRYRKDYVWKNHASNTITGNITIVLENGIVKSQTNSGGTGSATYYLPMSAAEDFGSQTHSFSITSITWTPV